MSFSQSLLGGGGFCRRVITNFWGIVHAIYAACTERNLPEYVWKSYTYVERNKIHKLYSVCDFRTIKCLNNCRCRHIFFDCMYVCIYTHIFSVYLMTLIFLKWVQKLACPFWEGEVNRTVAMRGRPAVHPRCR